MIAPNKTIERVKNFITQTTDKKKQGGIAGNTALPYYYKLWYRNKIQTTSKKQQYQLPSSTLREINLIDPSNIFQNIFLI